MKIVLILMIAVTWPCISFPDNLNTYERAARKNKKLIKTSSQTLLINWLESENQTPPRTYTKFKRSVSLCSQNWWLCLLNLPSIIQFRIRLDVLKFFDKFVTGRQNILDEAELTAEEAKLTRTKIDL